MLIFVYAKFFVSGVLTYLSFNHFLLSYSREDINVKFPVSSNASSTTLSILESEEQLRQLIWNRERIDEDIEREKLVLDNVRIVYNKKRGELVNFLAQSAPLADKVI